MALPPGYRGVVPEEAEHGLSEMEPIVGGLMAGWITLVVLAMSWMLKGSLDAIDAQLDSIEAQLERLGSAGETGSQAGTSGTGDRT